MNEAEYERMLHCEKAYWWHVARRRIVRKLTERFGGAPLTPDAQYLDLGCGNGILLEEFGCRFQRPVGTDSAPTALALARKRVFSPLVRSDARQLPFPDNQFDLITALDILEHVRDDLACVRECYRVSKPGAHLVVSVPALDFLWSEHDESAHHVRRYSWPSLKAKLASQGFEIVKGTYAVASLLPAVYLVRLLASFTRKSIEAQGHDFPRLPNWLNRVLILLHDVEAEVSLRVSLPMGTGLVCIARKPSTDAAGGALAAS